MRLKQVRHRRPDPLLSMNLSPSYRFFLIAISASVAVAIHTALDCRYVFVVGNGGEAESAEEALDRARWETMMLRDPATGSIPSGVRDRELLVAAHIASATRSLARMSARTGGFEPIARGPSGIGGRTRALAVDVGDSASILAAGASGGLWRSSDGGGTWRRTTSPVQFPGVTCIAQDVRPGKRSTWYYGTGEPYSSAGRSGFGRYSGEQYPGDGIFKSSDGGRSWTQLSSTASETPTIVDPFDWVYRISIDPTNLSADEVYALVRGGLARSSDGGVAWRYVLEEKNIAAFGVPDMAVTADGKVYAVFHGESSLSGVWRSVDGLNWTRITPAAWPSSGLRWTIASAPSNPNVMYILGATVGEGFSAEGAGGEEWHVLWKYTYLSGDGSGNGGRWENRTANLPDFGGTTGSFVSQSGYDLVAAVEPDDENTLFLGGVNLWRSTDGFATKGATTWIGGYHPSGGYLWYPGHHPDQHALAFLPGRPSTLLSGSDGGVHRTENCRAATVAWRSLNDGYRTAQFYTVAIDRENSGNFDLIGGMQDNGTSLTKSTDPSRPWQALLGGDGAFCAVASSRSAYYVASQHIPIYRFVVDSAGSVLSSTRVDPAGGSEYLFAAPYALDPSDDDRMYLAAGPYLWRNDELSGIPPNSSVATSVGWSRLERTNVRRTSGDSSVVTALGLSLDLPSNRVYYGTSDGRVYRLDDALDDDGEPTDVTSPEFPANAWVNCIAVDPHDGDRAVAVYSNYGVRSLFLTTDGGERWEAVAGNLEEHPDGSGNGPSCRWLSILHRPNGTLYLVGTSTGLYSTTRLEGSSTIWTQEGAESIGNVVVSMVAARESDGYVAIATHGNGVFSGIVGTLGADDPTGTAMASFPLLDPIRPNPARSIIHIGYEISASPADRPMDIDLALFDVFGQRVATIPTRTSTSHHHDLVYDISALPSGTYFCRLQLGSTILTRRLTISH